MAGKYHKNYGGVLYARILLSLKEANRPLTVVQVCDEVLPQSYAASDKTRVLRILNNMHQAGILCRQLQQAARPNVMRYTFKYDGI